MKLEARTSAVLNGSHYLGARGARARLVYEDEHGLITFSGPSSRRLPRSWVELSRWCILPGGLGSKQFRGVLAWLEDKTDASTIVSYSDPSVGHGGALYRACGWLWAPTWHALRPPPTGAGLRGGKVNAAKHRWVYLLRPDAERESALALRDEALLRRYPWAEYREPTWKRGKPQVDAHAGNFRRWAAERALAAQAAGVAQPAHDRPISRATGRGD